VETAAEKGTFYRDPPVALVIKDGKREQGELIE
jgi:hypothetical protein